MFNTTNIYLNDAARPGARKLDVWTKVIAVSAVVTMLLTALLVVLTISASRQPTIVVRPVTVPTPLCHTTTTRTDHHVAFNVTHSLRRQRTAWLSFARMDPRHFLFPVVALNDQDEPEWLCGNSFPITDDGGLMTCRHVVSKPAQGSPSSTALATFASCSSRMSSTPKTIPSILRSCRMRWIAPASVSRCCRRRE